MSLFKNKWFKLILLLLVLLIFITIRYLYIQYNVNYYEQEIPTNKESAIVNHQLWNQLLQENVDSTGKVNYKGFIQDSVKLKMYIDILTQNAPNDTWHKDEKLAYWVNLYNAATVWLICQNYPTKSIKAIKHAGSMPYINSVWEYKFIPFPKGEYSLGYIEHRILREQFNEPRIHFAIVCASYSCPRLLNEAYNATDLESQLSIQAKNFLSDLNKNIITKDKIQLSSIFAWFKSDFTKNASLIEYINQYSPTKIDINAQIEYLPYNWELNE